MEWGCRRHRKIRGRMRGRGQPGLVRRRGHQGLVARQGRAKDLGHRTGQGPAAGQDRAKDRDRKWGQDRGSGRAPDAAAVRRPSPSSVSTRAGSRIRNPLRGWVTDSEGADSSRDAPFRVRWFRKLLPHKGLPQGYDVTAGWVTHRMTAITPSSALGVRRDAATYSPDRGRRLPRFWPRRVSPIRGAHPAHPRTEPRWGLRR